MDLVVHPCALKQNQCIEFVILSGKWIELLLVGYINHLIGYHKCELHNYNTERSCHVATIQLLKDMIMGW